MIRSPRSSMLAHVRLRVAARRDVVEHRQHARRRAAVQRAGERPDRRRERGGAVGAGRRGDPRGERRRVQAVLGGGDPVGVDRLHVPRVGLAAPADQELRGGVLALRDLGVRAPAACRPRAACATIESAAAESRAEVVARLRGVDVDELAEPPLRAERRQAGLQVGRDRAARILQLDRLGGGMRELDVLVDEQAPDVLERVAADELLDVDAAIAERAAVPVRLGDLRLERDDALEAGPKSLADAVIGANRTATPHARISLYPPTPG